MNRWRQNYLPAS